MRSKRIRKSYLFEWTSRRWEKELVATVVGELHVVVVIARRTLSCERSLEYSVFVRSDWTTGSDVHAVVFNGRLCNNT